MLEGVVSRQNTRTSDCVSRRASVPVVVVFSSSSQYKRSNPNKIQIVSLLHGRFSHSLLEKPLCCRNREYVYSVAVYQKYLTRLGELIIFEPWRENYHFSQPS